MRETISLTGRLAPEDLTPQMRDEFSISPPVAVRAAVTSCHGDPQRAGGGSMTMAGS